MFSSNIHESWRHKIIDGGDRIMIRAVRAIYKDGKLLFIDKTGMPNDGSEVIVTFVDRSEENKSGSDAISALKGRGKGESLGEKLLKARKDDKEQDEKSYQCLRS